MSKTASFYCEICTKTLSEIATYASVARNLLKYLHSLIQIVKIQRVAVVNYYPLRVVEYKKTTNGLYGGNNGKRKESHKGGRNQEEGCYH